MLVKLLKNVEQNGVLKVNMRRGRPYPFVKDAVIDMSDASARKYIDAGLAEPYVEPASEPVVQGA